MILPATRIVTAGGTQGSGFVVACTENGTYVLTNHHVIRDSIQQSDFWDPVEKSSKKLERLLPVSVEVFRYDARGAHTQTVSTSAEIVAYTQYGDKWDFEGDLALLRLRASVEGMPSARIIAEEDFLDEVRMLDEVVMVGCPEGSELPLPTTGHVASMTEERAGVGLLLSQVFGNPGSSGSAVFRHSPERETYEVIAVHSMVDSRGSLTDSGRGSFLRLAVPAPKLHEFLRAHGFAHLAAPPAADEDAAEEAEAPATDDAAPSANETAPAGNETVPAGNETAPVGNETAPAGNGTDAADGAGDSEEPPQGEEPPVEPEGPGAAPDGAGAGSGDAASGGER